MTFEEAKEYLGDSVKEDGDLYDDGWYLDYTKGFSTATLDGIFDADDLEAISVYMRHFEGSSK